VIKKKKRTKAKQRRLERTPVRGDGQNRTVKRAKNHFRTMGLGDQKGRKEKNRETLQWFGANQQPPGTHAKKKVNRHEKTHQKIGMASRPIDMAQAFGRPRETGNEEKKGL